MWMPVRTPGRSGSSPCARCSRSANRTAALGVSKVRKQPSPAQSTTRPPASLASREPPYMRPVPSDQLADGPISPLRLQGGRVRQVGEDQREDPRRTGRVIHPGRLEDNRRRVQPPRTPPSRRRRAPSPCAHVRGRTSIAGPAGEVLRGIGARVGRGRRGAGGRNGTSLCPTHTRTSPSTTATRWTCTSSSLSSASVSGSRPNSLRRARSDTRRWRSRNVRARSTVSRKLTASTPVLIPWPPARPVRADN